MKNHCQQLKDFTPIWRFRELVKTTRKAQVFRGKGSGFFLKLLTVMKNRKFRPALGMILALAVIALLFPQGGGASYAGYRFYYTFSDRHGNTIAALEDAFASKVLLFTHGDPWTTREENQKPEIALGLPDVKGNDGDLNLGGGGVLVVELGLPVYDGSGYDLFVFEAGSGGAEEMQIAVSDERGQMTGSVSSVEIEGKSVGETFDLVFPVDNRAGNVAQLKTFLVSSASDMIPLSYPFAYAAKK